MAKRKFTREWLHVADTLGALAFIVAAGLFTAGLLNGAAGEDARLAEGPGAVSHTVVVDAGHGGADGGAIGTDTGAVEAEMNLAYALALKASLEERGFTVVLTRENENALAGDKHADLAARRDIMNEYADAVVSVHMNKFSDRSVSGPMAFYMKGSAEGEALAGAVIARLCEAAGRSARPANPGDYYVLRESEAPAVLVECGFLSNAADEALLMDEAHMAALMDAVAEGVGEYFAAR